MAQKILFCATVDYHFKAFHLPYMKWFKEQGWTVHIAASGNIDLPHTDHKYNIPIERSPIRSSNITAYKQLKEIIDDNQYTIIHCHTPLGGVLARIAARETRRNGTKVIYTAHGFHFCKGVSMLNWLIYYPIERYFARHTDSLITINQEDFELAIKHKFRSKQIKYVPGVGVDTNKFKPTDIHVKRQLKEAAGYDGDDLILFNASEFNKNKNQQFLLYAMTHILKEVPNARLLLAGEGVLLERCKQLAETLGISASITFLGFRSDIDEIISMCDIAVAASYREGLPVNVMEAMASGLPIVAVDNRGHRELVHNEINGYLIEEWDEATFAQMIKKLTSADLREVYGRNGRKIMNNKYSTTKILLEKSIIYQSYMGESEGVTWLAP